MVLKRSYYPYLLNDRKLQAEVTTGAVGKRWSNHAYILIPCFLKHCFCLNDFINIFID